METFYWTTSEYHHTNEVTMTDYLENHLPDDFDLTFDDGSLVEIQNKETNQKYIVRASGNGDSYNHKVEFELID